MINNIIKVILAAGISQRYGFRNKLLEKINKKTVIEQTLINLLHFESNSNNIKIILGHDYQRVKNVLNKYRIKIIYNKYYEKGLGASVSKIFEYNNPYQDGIMFIPADMPLISPMDYKNLIKSFIAYKSKKIICPFYKKQIGNPLIIPKRHFEKLVNLNSDKGAKHYLPKNDFVYIPSSFGTIFDVDNKYHLNRARFKIKKCL